MRLNAINHGDHGEKQELDLIWNANQMYLMEMLFVILLFSVVRIVVS